MLVDDLRGSKRQALDLKKELDYTESRIKELHGEIRCLMGGSRNGIPASFGPRKCRRALRV